MNKLPYHYTVSIAAILIGTMSSGCSIISTDTAKLNLPTTIASTRTEVISTAKGSPAAARDSYVKLETDFNNFIGATELKITSVGNSPFIWSTADLDISSTNNAPAWSTVNDDVSAFKAAANAGGTMSPHIAIAGIAINLGEIAREAYNGFITDRGKEATDLNAKLDRLKLPDWLTGDLKP